MAKAVHNTEKNMSRRAFAGSMGAVSVIAAGALLGGCSNSKDAQPDDDTSFSEQGGDSPADKLAKRIEDVIDSLTLEEKAAQLFIVRPEAITGVGEVIAAGEATGEALKQHPVCGFAYFAQNIIDPEQTKTMLANTLDLGYAANGLPLFLAIDEEGGTVTRVASNEAFGQTDVGNMSDIGATGDAQIARDAAIQIAGYLKPLGFNLDFAPVLDVANNPNSNVMRERSFGADAELVAKMGSAQVEGFIDSDMVCCAKHFPGIGASEGDSHEVSIYTSKSLEELRELELVPFAAAIESGVPMIMMGHLSAPNIVGDNTPASLSNVMVTDLLRKEMGYDGIVITDALEMAAAEGVYADEALGVLAIQAGCDIALMPPDYQAAYSGILEAVKSNVLDETRIDESLRRILKVKLSYLEEN